MTKRIEELLATISQELEAAGEFAFGATDPLSKHITAALVSLGDLKTAYSQAVQAYKRCPCCGREHSREDFAALPLVGEQRSEDDEARYLTTMRNCACGSTIAVEEKLS